VAILLLEDEGSLTLIIREFLESAGYAVLEFASSEDALAAGQPDGPSIDRILTDVVMPRMERARRGRAHPGTAPGDECALHVWVHRRGNQPLRRSRSGHPVHPETLHDGGRPCAWCARYWTARQSHQRSESSRTQVVDAGRRFPRFGRFLQGRGPWSFLRVGGKTRSDAGGLRRTPQARGQGDVRRASSTVSMAVAAGRNRSS